MLTGKRLFYGETDYQTVELVRNAKIPPIKPQNPQVEPELEDIVRKALAKRKEDRYQNATDIQDALAQYAYSRGLKVIARDIAELVRQCLEDRRMQSGEAQAEDQHHRPPAAGRDREVHLGGRRRAGRGRAAAVGGRAGAAPRTGTFPPPPSEGDFVDPRAWAEERLTPVLGIAEVDAMEARKTSRDMSPAAAPPRPAAGGRAPHGDAGAGAAPIRWIRRRVRSRWRRSSSRRPVPEALSPEALASTLEPPPTRSVAIRAHRPRKARNFLIGAAIGIVLLGAMVVAGQKECAERARAAPPPAATQTP